MITYEEYLAMTGTTADNERYDAAKKEFREAHPDAPVAEPVEVLNLIMKRVYADQILSGEKKVEIRNYSKHFFDRLMDRKVTDYEEEHWEDGDEMRDQIVMFMDPIRPVKRIHFHNYNNSWYLDVECTANGQAVIEDGDVKYLQDTYGFHEFDEELARLNKKKEKNRPLFYWFAIGDILDTNLPR